MLEITFFFFLSNLVLENEGIWAKALLRDLKAHKSRCNKGVFFHSVFPCNFDDQLSPKCSHVYYLMHMLDTPSEDPGIWQLPKVNSVFKPES